MSTLNLPRTAALSLILALSLPAGASLAGPTRMQATPPPVTEERVRQEADRRLGGAMAHLPQETKLRLARLALTSAARPPVLSNEMFRDKLYLEVILHSGTEEH